jgi:hypothetical protein
MLEYGSTMKTLHTILILILASVLDARGQVPSADIKIIINNTWWLDITPAGKLGLGCLSDSHPMSMTSSGRGVMDYSGIKQKIKSGHKLTDQNPGKSAIATLETGEKFLVSEDLLLEILQTAGKAKQWQGGSLNGRLRALLDDEPILKNKESQNKALVIADDAKPEKPKE